MSQHGLDSSGGLNTLWKHQAAGRAADASTQAARDFLVRDIDQHGHGDLVALRGQRLVERPGLLDRAREAVEQAAGLRVVAADALEQHADRDVVGDEFALVHVGLSQVAQLGAVAQVLAEHVAGREVQQPSAFGGLNRLCAFASAGRAKQNDIHDLVSHG